MHEKLSEPQLQPTTPSSQHRRLRDASLRVAFPRFCFHRFQLQNVSHEINNSVFSVPTNVATQTEQGPHCVEMATQTEQRPHCVEMATQTERVCVIPIHDSPESPPPCPLSPSFSPAPSWDSGNEAEPIAMPEELDVARPRKKFKWSPREDQLENRKRKSAAGYLCKAKRPRRITSDSDQESASDSELNSESDSDLRKAKRPRRITSESDQESTSDSELNSESDSDLDSDLDSELDSESSSESDSKLDLESEDTTSGVVSGGDDGNCSSCSCSTCSCRDCPLCESE